MPSSIITTRIMYVFSTFRKGSLEGGSLLVFCHHGREGSIHTRLCIRDARETLPLSVLDGLSEGHVEWWAAALALCSVSCQRHGR